MTWQKLAEYISRLTQNQRETDVTIYDIENDEFYKIDTFIGKWKEFPGSYVEQANGVLDDDHPFLAY